MKKTVSLILASGSGTRMGAPVAKQFLPLLGKPVYLRSAEMFAGVTDEVVIVTGEADTGKVREETEEAGIRALVATGGASRTESAYLGLRRALEAGAFDYVLVHDAARCLVTEAVIRRVLLETERTGAAIAAVPVKNTVKCVGPDGTILETPDRRTLWEAQTPQGFRTDLLDSAYRALFRLARPGETLSMLSERYGLTDDASLLERFLRVPVRVVTGDYANLKITTPEDLSAAEEILRKRGE